MRLKLLALTAFLPLWGSAQNLIVNPGAETAIVAPWTVVTAPDDPTCKSTVTWRANPAILGSSARTGTSFFFPGCHSATGGTYELAQSISVAANATAIDLGTATYTFAGWFSNWNQAQPDQCQFIEEYLNASNGVISSYNSGLLTTATNTTGTQSPWQRVVNTATVPVGTRTIRIRLRGKLNSGSAIDSYFDDLSLVTGSSPLPLSLSDFSCRQASGNTELSWKDNNPENYTAYQIFWGTNGTDWQQIGTVTKSNTQRTAEVYTYTHNIPVQGSNYYRVAGVLKNGQSEYTPVLHTIAGSVQNNSFTLSPNPATSAFSVTLNTDQPAPAALMTMQGQVVKRLSLQQGTNTIDTRDLAAGTYLFTVMTSTGAENKLMVINK